MLTQVEFLTANDVSLKIPMGGTAASSPVGYRLTEIDNLGPVKANVALSTFATVPGGFFESFRVDSRNPVFRITYEPDYTISDPIGKLRRALYPWFAPGTELKMKFYSDNMQTVVLNGIVETMEPDLFSADPQIVLSIICPYPNFVSEIPLTAGRTGGGVFSVNNPGTATVGFELLLKNFGSTPAGSEGFRLSRTVKPYQTLIFTGAVYSTVSPSTKHALLIRTKPGSKFARYLNMLTYNVNPSQIENGTNVIGYVDEWPSLIPGTNTFSLSTVSSLWPTEVVSELTFYPEYVGL